MPETTETAVFDRPPEELFRVLADFSNLADWDPVFEHSRRLDEGPLGPGARFGATAHVAGVDEDLEFVIVEYEEPWHVVLEGSGDRFSTRESIRVEPHDGGGCEVTFTSSFETDRADWVDAAGKPAYVLMGKAAIRGMKRTYGDG